MSRLRVVHLVDDTTAGGVMRVLDHILTAPELSRTAQHSLRPVDRQSRSLGQIDADVIVSHLAISWRILPALIALRVRHPRTPLIHVEHSYTERFVALNVQRKGRFGLLLRSAYRLFNRVVAVSHAQGLWLQSSGAVRADALCVIQSCVDLSAFRALAPRRTPVRVIGAIGRLDRQKGFDTLIDGFRRTTNPEIRLHIYGEGAEEEALRRLAGDDTRIHFKGFADNPVDAMSAIDAVAMPSLWEAYGLVAIEALSARRHLLVNAVDGMSDHLAYGAQDVRDRSAQAWATEIEKLTQDQRAPFLVLGGPAGSLEATFALKWQELLSSATKPARPR